MKPRTPQAPRVTGEINATAAEFKTVPLSGFHRYGDPAPDQVMSKGKVITFTAYPSIRVFIVKNDRGFYKATCPETGLYFNSGVCEKRYGDAVYRVWAQLESMRNAPNGAGLHSNVEKLVRQCIERTPKQATPATAEATK